MIYLKKRTHFSDLLINSLKNLCFKMTHFFKELFKKFEIDVFHLKIVFSLFFYIQYSQRFNGVTVTVIDFVRSILAEFIDRLLKCLAFSCR